MLRSKALTNKLLLLGIDGMDPRFAKALVDEGKMPNLKKLMDRGACREDLRMLGANPTITPPMWATLATGAYPMTHGIMDYNLSAENDKDVTIGAFSSRFLKAEPLWNVTAEEGKKTLVMHWPGGSFPPTSDSENLTVIDGSSPGACCAWSSVRDLDMVYVASPKCQKPNYLPMSTLTSELEGDEELKFMYPPVHDGVPMSRAGVTPEAKQRIKDYQKWYKEFIDVDGYKPDGSFVVDNVLSEEGKGLMWNVADFPTGVSASPVWPAHDWEIDVPADAKEFLIITFYGKVMRYGLLVKNAEGVYDSVAIYKDKASAEPLVVLHEADGLVGVYDEVPSAQGPEPVYRNMRLLKMGEDGDYVRIWASRGMSCTDDSVWFPKSNFQEVVKRFGPPQPTSQMCGNDADLIMKCNNEQWKLAAKWQSQVIHWFIQEQGTEVVFSHFHNIDLQSHNYMKYMKNRDTSRYDETEVRKFAEATYKVTDDYLGTFLHLIDEGWTLALFSDHALISCEVEAVAMGDNTGVSLEPLHKLGYTVLKRDENGDELPEVDWTKTKAIMTRSNSIYINVKGRDPYGIVDEADKYELEEQIITDLYSYKHPKTGHRIFDMALHNKDAILLGLGGPMGSDIVFFVNENYAEDHGAGLSTAVGHNDTSLGPIFCAAGPGVKENFRTDMYIREVDLAPTAAVLLGVDFPAQCEGSPAYTILSEKL